MFVKSLNTFIDALIPDRFKVTDGLKTKARGVIVAQVTLGLLLFFIGLFFWIADGKISELVLNTGMGAVLLLSVFALKKFNTLETYVGLILAIGYVVITIFVLIFGGIYADSPFWFAILLSLSLAYTTLRQTLFWAIFILVFLGSLFYLQTHGLDLNYIAPTSTKKVTTLISYFILIIASTYSYARINNQRILVHLETIAQHKRLLKERDDLMSIIAHDMKSPSRRIEGLISIFDTDNLREDQKEILGRLNKTALESKQLIDDLLEAKSFKSNVSIEKVSINTIIQELKNGFLPLSNKKNIRIITRGLRSKIEVETSSNELKRILDNLLSNAIKFSDYDKRVEIICAQNNSNTSISIQDQGPGFSPEDEKKMFQMFQKLSARPTGGESSSGLGLSIVKNLTEVLKGELKYVTKIGEGTTFTLVLPNKFS